MPKRSRIEWLNPDTDMKAQPIGRRRFLTISALGAGAAFLRPSALTGEEDSRGDLRFAIVSDVHLRYRPDEYDCPPASVSLPEERHAAFLRAAADWGADVVIDLGDLQPRSFTEGPGKQALEAWRAWPKEKIAVFGNHDDDFLPKETYLREMGMPAAFYSKTVKGRTFIVLDSGDPAIAPGTAGADWGQEQLPWLRDEIDKAPGHCVILIHHGTEPGRANLPPERLQAVIDKANETAGHNKVAACFRGHLHRTAVNHSRGVYHVLVNSASYRWVRGHGPVFYRDPSPWAMGSLSSTGVIRLQGTGRPGNWAADCERTPGEVLPADELTYQKSIPPA